MVSFFRDRPSFSNAFINITFNFMFWIPHDDWIIYGYYHDFFHKKKCITLYNNVNKMGCHLCSIAISSFFLSLHFFVFLTI